jgi:hypothetical protein
MFQRLSEGDFCSAAHRKLFETEQQEITAARMRDGEHWGERTHSRTMQRRLADPKAKTGALAEYVVQRPTLQPRPAAQLPSMAQESPALPSAPLPTSSGLLPEILESQGIPVPAHMRRSGMFPERAPDRGLPDLAETVKLAVPAELLRTIEPNTSGASYASPYAAPEQPPAEFGLPGLASTAAWLEGARWTSDVPPLYCEGEPAAASVDSPVEAPAGAPPTEPFFEQYHGPTAFDPERGADLVPPAARMLEVPPLDGPHPDPVLHRAEPAPMTVAIPVWSGAIARSEDRTDYPTENRAEAPAGSWVAADWIPASMRDVVAPPPPDVKVGRLAATGSPLAAVPPTPIESLARRATADVDALRFAGLSSAAGLLRWEPPFPGALDSPITIGRAASEALPPHRIRR